LSTTQLAGCVDGIMAQAPAKAALTVDLHGARNSAALLKSWASAAT